LHEALLFKPGLPQLEDFAALTLGCIALLIGYAVFRRLSPHFEDFV
jgi:hypothetical protein